MPDISAIQNTPDVSFIDNKTIDDVRGDMVADFEAFMLQATGSKVSRQPVRRERIFQLEIEKVVFVHAYSSSEMVRVALANSPRL